MAFKLGDLVIDRIVNGVAETISKDDETGGKLLYLLTNLQEASINITSESVDAVDGTGSVIKTFYRGKQGEFTATNSLLSLPIINAMSGETEPTYAGTKTVDGQTVTTTIDMPIILNVARTGAGAVTSKLPGITDNGENNHIIVHGVDKNGTLGDKIENTSGWSVSVVTGKESEISITDNAYDHYIIKYDRTVSKEGIKIVNRADKYPTTVKLTLKVLIVDPCEPDQIRAAYVVLPSFQPSAEIDMTFSTDATLDFTGTLQTSYCGTEKVLYEIYVCYDDVEDAA